MPAWKKPTYLTLSALGLLLPVGGVVRWLGETEAEGLLATQQAFVADAFANPAAAALGVDVLLLGLATMVFVYVEARRLEMPRWPWVYPIIATVLAAAFAFPLFLYFRERRLETPRSPINT